MNRMSDGKVGGHDFHDVAGASVANLARVKYTNNKAKVLRQADSLRQNGGCPSQIVAIC